MSESDKIIVNLCPTGMVPRRAKVPTVPITPEEIAADVRRCHDAGASMVHLHARDDDEEPTWRRERFQEICDAVVQAVPTIVVIVTTSGRNWSDVPRRSEALHVTGAGRPEMASLTLGSMNFASGPSVNAPDTIEALATAMRDLHIVPELEVFDIGMIDFAHHLIEKGVLKPPYYVNILLGSRGTANLSAANVAAALSSLPAGSTWALAGVGKHQVAANAIAAALGGHMRVGLEDNPYYDWKDRGVPTTNARLVERSVRIAREFGREPASPEEARRTIGLPVVERVTS